MRALLCVIMLLLGTVNNGMAETMVFSSIGGFTLYNEYGKFGILDSKSRIVREALYDTAYPIDENLIYVSQNNRYGLLQNNGIEIIPCEYNELFCEKCCIIATDETGVYLFSTEGGKALFGPVDGLLPIEGSNGKMLQYMKDAKAGVVTCDGEVIVPEEYDDILFYSEGFFCVVENTGECAYVDYAGKILMDHMDYCTPFSEGVYMYSQNGVIYAEDACNKKKRIFSEATAFGLEPENGIFTMIGTNGACYIYDVLTDTVIRIQAEDIDDPREGIIALRIGQFISFYNTKGEKISEKEYLFAYPCRENSICVQLLDGKWTYITKHGKALTDMTFDKALPFSNGYAAICQNGLWGFIDRFGQLVIPCIYYAESSPFFYDSYAFLMDVNGNHVCIDQNGNVVSMW